MFFHEFLELLLVLVGYLDNHTGVFCHKHLYNVIAGNVVQVDVQSALWIGEAHFQQASDQAASADIVSGHDPSFLDEFLNGIETVYKVVGVSHGRHIVTHLAQTLCKGTAT